MVIVAQVCQKFGRPVADLFSSKENTQGSVWFSLRATDAPDIPEHPGARWIPHLVRMAVSALEMPTALSQAEGVILSLLILG